MSLEISPAVGKCYGLKRVCQVLAFPRSTVYARRRHAERDLETGPPPKRGPKPPVSDADLLAAIRADLDASPFVGEGHRKVWARLRIVGGLRVSRRRVLCLMGENRLLSPYRGPVGVPNPHTGTITTEVPNEMWGTDGVRVETAENGWVWVFSAVDHCTADCVGWHVTKVGNRFAALEPIAQAIMEHFGGIGADVARGLSLRFDHGSQYMSDHFLNQVRAWGIALSPGYVAEPQTNGVAERFNRTLKEQAIHGRIFRNLEEVRQAVATFVECYNAQWRLEKLGFLTPLEARRMALLPKAA